MASSQSELMRLPHYQLIAAPAGSAPATFVAADHQWLVGFRFVGPLRTQVRRYYLVSHARCADDAAVQALQRAEADEATLDSRWLEVCEVRRDLLGGIGLLPVTAAFPAHGTATEKAV
ncbi:hypothetical protein GCM10010121_069170 [Streptomyces brasiliensis]|uniref:Uncharacterized protein n=1 Tax=Streptomyces brasiliensis TaxID=1954 RepID=A0A917L6K4_9ACTN|nr:hypothetical protein GCM10010121_069170 [Streptomyces brasiliensis]